jgi:PTH1 family peptidyl-tRNA hydrolase
MYDDADLELGRLRVRGEGSSGGHNGMQSIIDALGTNGIPRLRLGVGRSEGPRDGLKDHVLSRFDRHEEKLVKEMVDRAVSAVESWLDRGLAATMNEFNSRTKETE